MSDVGLGTLFIFSSPSGGGKTSLVRALCNEVSNFEVSISHTTREKRTGEVDGKNYFFIDNAKFDAMAANNEFLEHAEVYTSKYGTSRQWVEDTINRGVDVALDIDWQGARQIKQNFPGAISIYILPPSKEVLLERLRERQRDTKDQIDSRMKELQEEMAHFGEYDYLIVNDIFENSREQLKTIIAANRLRIENQKILKNDIISGLQKP